MLTSRPLAVPLVFLALIVALWSGSAALAQVPPIPLPSGATSTGTINATGSYNAKVTAPGQPFFERAGTYQAAVTFTADVSVFGLNIETQSGSYQASGPFTAIVSAPGVLSSTVTGTYTASGTFAAGTFTSSGQWAVSTGGVATGSHRGGGTYNLSTMTVAANGQYDGAVTSSERGPFSVDGPYSGNGTFTVGVMRIESQDALQISPFTDIIAGIAGLAASGPAAATALEMRNTTTPPPPGTGGVFSSGTIAPAGVSIVSFTGTTAQLGTAAAAAKVVTVSAAVGGKLLSYVVGAPAFVNTDFNAAFPTGLTNTLVIVKT